MKLAALIFENFIQDSFYGGDSALPFLWQIIYHEATRANHMLFDREDLEKFDSDQSGFGSPQEKGGNELSTVMMDLLSCNEIDKIQNRIRALPYQERRQIFSVYLRFIERWRIQIKQSLN